jgi:hypothetical protein
LLSILLCLLAPPRPPMPPPTLPTRVVGRYERQGEEAAVIDTDSEFYLDGQRCSKNDVAGAAVERIELDRTGTHVLRLRFKTAPKGEAKP